MKGKTKNHRFIAEYIAECSSQKLESPELIIKKAVERLAEVDDKLKEIINLKKERSDLLDVIFYFNKKIK